MSVRVEATGGGLGFTSVLTIVFIVLKLAGIIGWSWWWVLSPILIEFGILILLLIGLIAYVVNAPRRQRRIRVRMAREFPNFRH